MSSTIQLYVGSTTVTLALDGQIALSNPYGDTVYLRPETLDEIVPQAAILREKGTAVQKYLQIAEALADGRLDDKAVPDVAAVKIPMKVSA